ncbi:MAG: hypothetical protein M3Q31_13475 [Actinomycetota bacterium]|nr:hypothetical protein [Actinomycetota bacterium]
MSVRTFMATATALGAAAALLPAAGLAAPGSASLVIRHQLRGCHEWSLNGGKYSATQAVKLSRGGSLMITDNDLMPHQLIVLSGSAVAERLIKPGNPTMGKMTAPYKAGLMPHLGATLRVTFNKPGVYKLRTKSLEDYVHLKTVGTDNVLRVTVVVS